MAEIRQPDEAGVTDRTCGVCLEDSTDPLNLPCGHSFCAGCLNEWRSRYGVDEEMRRKCPICRARIPPSTEMVAIMNTYRAVKQRLVDENDTTTEHYHDICSALAQYEERVGADWDGVTVLEDNNGKPAAVEMPHYILKATGGGDIKSVLKWINANRTEDRANAMYKPETLEVPALSAAATYNELTLMTLLLQLGADIDYRAINGLTTIGFVLTLKDDANKRVRLLLSWGATFFPGGCHSTREDCISKARKKGAHDLATLMESELGGRRCEIVNVLSRPELNGKTCVAHEYLPDSNQYRVTLETKRKEGLLISPDNLKRRDRTPQDCGYYIDFKDGRAIRHDFDSSEDCQAFVSSLNSNESEPVVTEEAEARAEQAAAELLAERGLDDSPGTVSTSENQVKKAKKKKKGGKKKKKK